MAHKPKDSQPREFKRLNRTVGVGEAVSGALDPALKRRGFASRDIVTHWRAMAPAPYDRVTMPDKLSWPRGERSAQGATLYLRCVEGHQLALAHEGARIAAAVNRYFGYVLVNEVRLAITPFSPGSAEPAKMKPEPDPVHRALVARAVSGVKDQNLREALRELGHSIATKAR
ncbi:MAG: DciA family protein [Devosia sp.]|nr:DciA family protein [Devosia sp.]